jgi:ABC-type multidrug transport system fused ATPase/permease subunit
MQDAALPVPRRRVARRLLALAWRQRGPALGVALLASLGTALVLVFPQAMQHALDEVLPHRDLQAAWRVCAWLAAAFLLRDLLAALRGRLAGVFEQRLIHDLRGRLHERIAHLPLASLQRHRTGDLLARLADDVPAAQRAVQEGVEQGLTAILQILVCAGMLFATSPRYALIILLPVPLLAAGGWLFAHLLAPRARRARDATGRLGALLHETITGIRLVKSLRAENARQQAFETVSSAAGREQRRLASAWAVYSPLMCLLGSLGLVLLLGTGVQGILDGELTQGELLKLILLLGFFYEPMARLHGVNQTLTSGLAAASRVFELLDAADRETVAPPPPRTRGELELRGVGFGHSPDMPVLHGIHLHLPAGRTAALVGVSGCGKSTLLDLLAGLAEPQTGSILLDGKPASAADLRAQVAYVMQDAFLFSGSLRANLQLARPEADDETLWTALRMASAEEFIRARPEGLDLELGERGARLSGGERQRLALARAILQDAPVLLLDEATSAVDAESEQRLQQSLAAFCANRTCLVVTHRLTTVARVDVIHVMSGGRLIASGRHAELLESCPHYRHLASLAFA